MDLWWPLELEIMRLHITFASPFLALLLVRICVIHRVLLQMISVPIPKTRLDRTVVEQMDYHT